MKDIKLYNVAAFGLGYDMIKDPNHTLTFRAGLGYRYEGYDNPATADVSSVWTSASITSGPLRIRSW